MDSSPSKPGALKSAPEQSAAARDRARTSRFFDVHVQELTLDVPLLGLCAGFENGAWRSEGLSAHLMDYLAEFALTRDEWPNVNVSTAYRALRRAARAVYTTSKYKRRGEVGELLLHAVMREHYGAEPIVSKFFFKSASNETVKGFDAVHIILGDSSAEVELWLGEVKLYSQIDEAIRDVCAELNEHTSAEYLRSEFMWIENKLAKDAPAVERVRHLLNEATSLDEVFDVLHIPVLLTYDSETVRAHTKTTEAYKIAFKTEVAKYHQRFVKKNTTKKIRIHLCLVPLGSKAEFLEQFDRTLKGLQGG